MFKVPILFALRAASSLLLLVALTVIASCAAAPATTATPTKSAAAPSSQAPTPVTGSATPSSSSAPSAAPEKLKIAYTSNAGAYAPLWLAKEAGIYQKYGLDVDLTLIAGTSIAYTALMKGEVDVVGGGPTGVLPPIAEGADLAIIGSFSDKLQYRMMVKQGIRQPADLKGKKIGIVRPRDSDHILVEQALQMWGISPKDVLFVTVGAQADRVTALQSGIIDATTVSPPANLILEKAGFYQLADLADLGIPYVGVSLNTSRTVIRERPAVLEKLISALVESVHLFKTDANVSKSVLTKYIKIDDPEVLELTYSENAKRMQELPSISPEGLKPMIESLAEQNPRAKDLDLRRVIDSTFVDKVGKSGLLEKLYGKR